MKKALLFLFFLFIFVSGYSQWNTVNLGTSGDLYSISYYSGNYIWIGSGNSFIKSSNGGTSWAGYGSVTDNSGLTIPSAFLNDIVATGPSSAISVGLFNFGSDEYILNTTNGGSNWNYASDDNSAPVPRYLNAVDVNSNRAVVVGNNGRIATSSNSGTSWSYTSAATSNYLYDVKFASFDTVFAVGQNLILRSTDGGTTWTSKTTTQTCQSVSCQRNVIYIGNQSSNILFKSTDYGVTYASDTLPFTCGGAIVAISKDTIIAAGTAGLYISNTGGATWEKYIIPGSPTINMIDFSGSNVMAVGNAGYAIRTTNFRTCPTLPVASFIIPGLTYDYCLGDSIKLNNTTSPFPGYNYQWEINGVPFDTHYNSGVRLTYEGNNTVTLMVSNANGVDSVSQGFTVIGHTIPPMVISSTSDSTCSGNMVSFSIPSTQFNDTYQLRKGFTKIGSSQLSNGNGMIFTCPLPIPVTTTFNIIAIRTSQCFTDSLVQTKTINIINSPNPLTPACTPGSNLCANHGITNVSLNTINYTTDIAVNNYFDYSCCQKTDLVAGVSYPMSVTTTNWEEQYVSVWIDLNNDGLFTSNEIVFSGTTTNFILAGNLTIPPTAYVFNQYLRMRVESNITSNEYNMSACGYSSDCGQIEDYAVRFLNAPTPPVPSFTSLSTVGCNTSIAFTSTSYNATSYTWNFGDSSAISNLRTPTHIYTVSGNFTVSLKACNAYGCDSTLQVFPITVPLVPIPAGCAINISSGHSGNLGAMYFDTIFTIPHPIGGTYADYTCTKQYRLHAGSSYSIQMETSLWSGCSNFGIWIDFNNDGLFTSNEEVNAQVYMYTVCTSVSDPIVIQIPTSAVQSTPLRMRVIIYDGSQGYLTDACSAHSVISGGQALDFTVFIDPPLPVIPAFHANITTVCTNSSVNFLNTSSNSTTYLWDFGDGSTSTAVGATPHIYTTAGTYTVKLVCSNGTYTDSIVKTNYITVNQSLPAPIITLNGTTLSTNAVATHYQWYKNGSAIAGDTLTSVNVGFLSGVYTVVIKNTNGCTTTSAGYSYYPIHANFTCSPTAICGFSTYTLLTNSSTNGTSYNINWGDGTLYTYNGSGGPIHTYTATGVYTVTMSACNSGVCDTMTRTNYITISTPPTTPVVTFNGTQLTTTASAATNQWYLNNVLITGATTTSYTPTTDGVYKITENNPGCTAVSGSFNYYHVNVAFHATTTSYCGAASQNVAFTSTTTNATSYLWNFGDGGTSTVASPTHTYTGYGTYTVKLKACGTINCDSVTSVNYITINPSPAVPVITLSGTQLSTPSVATGYQWYLNNVLISGATSSSYNPTVNGVYKLTITNNGCSATSANFSYYPVHVAFSGNTLSFCGSFSQTVTFTNTTTNATNYNWDFGDGQTSAATSPAHTYTNYGTYTVKLKACGATNCDSLTYSNYITLKPSPALPVITYNGSNISTASIDSTYQWYFNNAVISGAKSTSYTPTQDGVYKLQVTNNGCSTYSANYSYYPVHISFTADTVNFCGTTTSTVTFTNNTTNATSYNWDFGDGTYSTAAAPSHTFAAHGVYSVKLVACGNINCDSVTIINYINTNLAPVVPVVTYNGSALSTTAIDTAYQWYLNNSIINGATSASYTPTQDGVYSLLVTNNGCSISSAGYSYYPVHISFTADTVNFCGTTTSTVTFTNNTTNATSYNWDFGDGTYSSAVAPSHTFAAHGVYTVKLVACGNTNCDSVTYINYINTNLAPAVPVVTYNGNAFSTVAIDNSYQWYVNNSIVNGAASSSYTPTQDGIYSLLVTNNGCSISSAGYSYYPVHISFTADTINFCGTTTSTVTFTNNTINATSYNWDFGDGTAASTVPAPSHTFAAHGVYTVKLVACGNTNCDSVTNVNYINTNLAPAVPVVTYNGSALSTVAIDTAYQWYVNNSIINGATSSSYTPTQDGVYSLQVTNNGCSISSANYSYYPVHISFTADTVNFCGTTTSTVTFTNNTTNATSYNWDFGDGTYSSSAAPAHTYTGTGNYNVKLTACGITNCDSVTYSNYIIINPLPSVPLITITGSALICAGSQVQLSANYISGNTYQWVENDTLIAGAIDTSYFANTAGTYYLSTSNSFGCSAQSANTVITVDNNCVWPGDADNNHVVDNFDLLPLGVYYSQTGNARSIVSNSWQSYPVLNWGSLENPANVDIKHADCNGDGIIDNNDTLAINLNFSLTHAITSMNSSNSERSANPDIYFVTASNHYNAGDTVNVEVWTGTAALPVANLYGAAFNINYNAAMVQPGSEQFIYAPCWLGTPGTDAITLSKIDALVNTAYGAITRINHTDVNGYGKVADFRFRVNTAFTNPAVMNFNFSNNLGDDASGNTINFNTVVDSIFLNEVTTGINSGNALSGITIYPNPFTDATTIYFGEEQKHTIIKIMDMLGNEVKTINMSGTKNITIERGELNAGVYFVEIIDENKNEINRKIVIQ